MGIWGFCPNTFFQSESRMRKAVYIMLVFMRKEGETFYIGDNVEITIAEVKNDRVKISVNAPKEIPVMRKELLEQKNFREIKKNNEDIAV